MEQKLLIPLVMSLLLISFASAALTVTVDSPANSSTLTTRNDIDFSWTANTNSTDPICSFRISANSGISNESGIAVTDEESYTKTIDLLQDGTYSWIANCSDAAAQTGTTGKNYVTIDAFTYGGEDVAVSGIDLLVSIFVGLVGFASLVAMILVARWIKKK